MGLYFQQYTHAQSEGRHQRVDLGIETQEGDSCRRGKHFEGRDQEAAKTARGGEEKSHAQHAQ